MEEEILMFLEEAKEKMVKSIGFLKQALAKIRVGKVTPSILENIKIEYYDSMTLLNQVASITSFDARILKVKPWEKNLILKIEKVLISSDLGANIQSNADGVILTFPQITEERRKILAKQVREKGEETKISIRGIRKETNDVFKKMQKDGAPEDMIKDSEQEVQKLTNRFITKTDETVDKKEKDIMSI